LKKRDPSYRERSEVTVAGGLELRAPEMEQALSRFNQTVARAVSRARGELRAEGDAVERAALPPAEGQSE
jgi:hypothetical protein